MCYGQFVTEPRDHEADARDDLLAACLRPTHFIDSDHPDLLAYARAAAGDAATPTERAVRLFYAVRDGLRYDPYSVSLSPDDYRASVIAGRDRAFCVPKAILLTACARALGIPARLGFADVKNHLASDKLRQRMGTDLFVYHGYAELYLEGRWLKVTPAFNLEMCQRFGVAPLEFDGTSDALLHPFDTGGRRHMEYVRDRGSHVEFPFADMLATFAATYGGRAAPVADEHDPAFHGDEGDDGHDGHDDELS